MKAQELRNLSTEELREELKVSREKLFNLRLQASIGNAEDFTQVGKVRKDIARMETVLREGEMKREKETES